MLGRKSKPETAVDEVERRHAAGTGRQDAGRRPQAIDNRFDDLLAALGRRRRSTEIHASRQDIGGVVARVDVHERDKAAHEQRRPDEEHDAHGRLGRQQQVPHPLASAGAALIVRSQRGRQPGSGGAQGRKQTGECAGDDGDDHGEGQHSNVEPDVGEAWKIVGRPRRQRPHQSPGEEHSQRTTRETQGDALGQQLPRQTAAPGAECGPDRELTRPGDAPGEQQIRHIRARDEQDQPHRRQEHEHGRAYRARHLVDEPTHAHLDGSALAKQQIGRHRPLHAARRRCSLGRRLLHRDAGLQPRDGVNDAERSRATRRQHIRRPHLRIAVGKVEPRGSDADDLVHFPVELHGAADGRGFASEAALPQGVTDDDDARRARDRVVITKKATGGRRDAKQREDSGRHGRALDSHRLVEAANGVGPDCCRRPRRRSSWRSHATRRRSGC